MLKPTVTRKHYQNSIVSGFLVSLLNWKMNPLNHCQSDSQDEGLHLGAPPTPEFIQHVLSKFKPEQEVAWQDKN
jgi:hypothetical protein